METDPLRASNWKEYIGQENHKAALEVRISAAFQDVRPLDHILIVGPAGTGKTTLASIIAQRIRDPFKALSMPLKPPVLLSELRQFDTGGILFLDEVHRLGRQQEDLLPLLWDGYYQASGGQRVEFGWLTVIAATTEEEKVIPALHSRFMVHIKLDPYTTDEMTQIVTGMAERAKVPVTPEQAAAIGRAAAGTPRTAQRLVLGARDLHRYNGNVEIAEVLSLCRVEPDGLTQNHVEYLRALRALGGTAGLATIASMLRLHETVIRDLERLLVERGYVLFGGKGRELTGLGWKYGRETEVSRRRT